jgi:hypothetical protein
MRFPDPNLGVQVKEPFGQARVHCPQLCLTCLARIDVCRDPATDEIFCRASVGRDIIVPSEARPDDRMLPNTEGLEAAARPALQRHLQRHQRAI